MSDNSNSLYIFGAILLFVIIAIMIYFFTTNSSCGILNPCGPGQTCISGVCVNNPPGPREVEVVRNVDVDVFRAPVQRPVRNVDVNVVRPVNRTPVVKTEYGIPEF